MSILIAFFELIKVVPAGLVWGLLEAAGDANESVRQTVASSLTTLGQQHPPLVLSAIHKFISSPQTAPKASHLEYITFCLIVIYNFC